MVKKVIALLFVCTLVVGALGCGSSEKNPTDIQSVEYTPSLEEARRARDAGEPLTAKQRRILDDEEVQIAPE